MSETVIVARGEALKNLIDDAVQSAVVRIIPEAVRRATRKPWLTREEVLELTGWSKRSLAYLRKERKLAFSQHGRKIVYDTSSVEALLDSGYVPARRGPGKTQKA